MTGTTDYRTKAQDDARDTARNFSDVIAEMLVESGAASNDLLNDYSRGDEYHHENHVDKAYSLQEAAELLDQLSEWEETDSGLWEGLPPREAIAAQAAYTYGNAVCACFQDVINAINFDAETGILADILDEDNPDVSKDKRQNLAEGRVLEIIDEDVF